VITNIGGGSSVKHPPPAFTEPGAIVAAVKMRASSTFRVAADLTITVSVSKWQTCVRKAVRAHHGDRGAEATLRLSAHLGVRGDSRTDEPGCPKPTEFGTAGRAIYKVSTTERMMSEFGE
jgi:hypothetical protein